MDRITHIDVFGISIRRICMKSLFNKYGAEVLNQTCMRLCIYHCSFQNYPIESVVFYKSPLVA